MNLNFTAKNSALLDSMYDYTIVPNEKMMKRMDYFYTPYNQQFQLRRHMTFEDNEDEQELLEAQKPKRRPEGKSGLDDIIERLAAAKK